MNATQYWMKVKLPFQLDGLTMEQLTALRRMIIKAFADGKKHAG